jgi:hypothetical protein
MKNPFSQTGGHCLSKISTCKLAFNRCSGARDVPGLLLTVTSHGIGKSTTLEVSCVNGRPKIPLLGLLTALGSKEELGIIIVKRIAKLIK